jgi:tetrahydromethanopterin S-methyltransferase subunit C
MTQVQPHLDETPSHRFAAPAEDDRVVRTVTALEANVFPVEDARAVAAYGVGNGVNKVLIINRQWTLDRITVVLCDETLGF